MKGFFTVLGSATDKQIEAIQNSPLSTSLIKSINPSK